MHLSCGAVVRNTCSLTCSLHDLSIPHSQAESQDGPAKLAERRRALTKLQLSNERITQREKDRIARNKELIDQSEGLRNLLLLGKSWTALVDAFSAIGGL